MGWMETGRTGVGDWVVPVSDHVQQRTLETSGVSMTRAKTRGSFMLSQSIIIFSSCLIMLLFLVEILIVSCVCSSCVRVVCECE
jgi:hypothetical protein